MVHVIIADVACCAVCTRTKWKGAIERGYDLSAARWGTLRWFSRCQWSPEGTLHLLFHPRQTFQLHLLHKGRSPAAVWRLARKTRPLLHKLKNAAEDASQLGKLLGGIRLSGRCFFGGFLFFRKKSFYVFLRPNQFLHLISCLAVVRVGSFLFC